MDEVQGADVLAELRELRLRVAELERTAAAETPTEERSTRRGMLRLAGAAVVGGAATSLLSAQPLAANTGDELIIGNSSNDAGAAGTSLTASSVQPTFSAFNTVQGAGLAGHSTGLGIGVTGTVTSAGAGSVGVFGSIDGTSGYALLGSGGTAQLRLIPAPGTGFSSVFHRAGDVYANADGVFACVINGAPGVWRKLAGPATAGSFHAVAPTRVYDSRASLPNPGMLPPGGNRIISVADGRDGGGTINAPNIVPAKATAIFANVTITGTTGGFGFLCINPGGDTSQASSAINWSAPNLSLANGLTLTLNSSRQITVVCGTGGGSTHFIIDVSGYYL